MAEAAAATRRRLRVPDAVWAMLAGLALAVGQAPLDLWFFTLAGLVALFVLLPRLAPGRGAFGFGWLLGAAYFAVALAWIVEPFLVDAAAHAWMAPFALIGLAGGLGLFWAAAFWIAARVARARAAVLIVAWTAAEMARSYVLTGFPWAVPSQAFLDVAVMQWAAVAGQLGVWTGMLIFAALLAWIIRGPDRIRAIAVGFVAAAVLWGGGRLITPPLQDLSDRPIVRLVQPNAPQHEKWDPAMIPVFFDRAQQLTAAPPRSAPPALVVWPETALPMLLDRAGPTLSFLAQSAGGVPFASGIQRLEDGRFYNSLVLTDADGEIAQVYDKHHLVPFGEYMPLPWLFSRLGIVALATRVDAGYTPGPGAQTITVPGLGAALPLICYEAVFPHRLNAGNTRPDWLLHVTNDAWFGSWSGPYQHLAQARIRSIEQGLPMLRVANTGVSAAIDGAGRVIARTPLNEAGLLDVPLPAPLGETPYARTGDWPLALLLVLATAALLVARRRLSD